MAYTVKDCACICQVLYKLQGCLRLTVGMIAEARQTKPQLEVCYDFLHRGPARNDWLRQSSDLVSAYVTYRGVQGIMVKASLCVL